MELVGTVLETALSLFLLLLLARLVMSYVFLLARSYRPSGPVAAVLEVVYSITDPALNALRSVLPPLRLGSISFDLAFLVLFILVSVLRGVVQNAF